MTQDYGPGYVVRGEVVADDDADEYPAEQDAPMTHFQKVASALRGDQTEPSAPDAAGTGFADSAQAGTDSADSGQAGTDYADAPSDEEDRSDEVGAVRSPDAGGRDYWDDEDDTEPAAAAAVTPATPGSLSAETEEPVEDRDRADTATGPHEVTAPSATMPAAPVPAAPVPAAPVPAAPVPAASVPTAPVRTDSGVADPGVTGKHAGAPAEPELRPGEADAGLGDFSDLTYGSLLPDASEFRERWQQVQFRFVDDPHGSVTEAADVITQVTARLEAAIAERQRAIAERQRSLRGRWGDGTNADTETLRATLLMYRVFLDQLTGSRG